MILEIIMAKLSDLVLESLKTKECTLKDLYLIVEDHKEFDWEPSVRKHRIRSAIFSLKTSEKVKQTGPSTYKAT